MKVLTIVGARPQFIKASAVSRVIGRRGDVREVLIHTGQHYDDELSRVFFDELDIPSPDRNLGIGSGSHGAQTGQMLAALEAVLVAERPHWVIVYGDTNSTLAGALAAAKLRIPLAHVEAGLRSFNRAMPEELNRILTDHAADLLLAPTATAAENLRREGLPERAIRQVGDVMYDVARSSLERSRERSRILTDLGLREVPFVLATIHRAENTDEPVRLSAIMAALAELTHTVRVVLPLHPRTREALRKHAIGIGAVELIPPVGYLDMLMLLSHAQLVATDSGGVQKEAFFVGTPCATLRSETEWVELIACGWNRLICPTGEDLAGALQAALEAPKPTDRDPRLFGDGHAAEQVVAALLESRPSGCVTPC